MVVTLVLIIIDISVGGSKFWLLPPYRNTIITEMLIITFLEGEE